ncbi:hypothetical protein VNI00_019171 [Paramarasmius palmivorus]|uniref:HNH nuclease domain-containing protein n=1 Tax=Paramarasmius palmivorus TaxID=297713 RepID=A0AAW0APC2_9AGAR
MAAFGIEFILTASSGEFHSLYLEIPLSVPATVTDHTLLWVLHVMTSIAPSLTAELHHEGVKVDETSNLIIGPETLLQYNVYWDEETDAIASPKALIERTTSSDRANPELQQRLSNFRKAIEKRERRKREMLVDGAMKKIRYNYCAIVDEDAARLETVENVRSMGGTCTAIHVLPHRRGNSYITRVSRKYPEPVEHIDDIRNGLLVWTPLHPFLGCSKANGPERIPKCSFLCASPPTSFINLNLIRLQVPNKYLRPEHMKYSNQPSDVAILNNPDIDRTVQFHIFDPTITENYGLKAEMICNPPRLWNGKLLREPEPSRYRMQVSQAVWDHHYASTILGLYLAPGPATDDFADFCDRMYYEGGGEYVDPNDDDSDSQSDNGMGYTEKEESTDGSTKSPRKKGGPGRGGGRSGGGGGRKGGGGGRGGDGGGPKRRWWRWK